MPSGRAHEKAALSHRDRAPLPPEAALEPAEHEIESVRPVVQLEMPVVGGVRCHARLEAGRVRKERLLLIRFRTSGRAAEENVVFANSRDRTGTRTCSELSSEGMNVASSPDVTVSLIFSSWSITAWSALGA